ncbi:NlpC/P60 family protein [Clostridium ganghwense]|uniref:NlpC/P60 family protein n=1 Tax=Clostridium ganghwense TaxID=312089 RepID=A0ABT4CPT1_9CLOT|nr:C40 family peptidase [Clostridium ganghwense]MCY6370241.1 NlpC/P60 family protein [Clostridium ganghwense]
MNKRLATLVTTAALIVSVSTTAVLAEPLSDKLKSQQKQLQQHKADYNSAQKKVEKLEQAIEHLDDQIETAMDEIESTKKKIEDIKKKIELTEKDIQKAEEDMEAEKKLYNERMRVMYMRGAGGGYIDVLLGAEDLSDLFSKVQAVKKVSELDRKMVKELKEKQEELRIKKEELTKQQKELVALNAVQQEKMAKLKKDKAEQDKLVKQAKAQRSVYASKLNKDKKLIDQTKKMIQQMNNPSSSSNNRPSRGENAASASSSEVVSYAMKFQGTPYVWGANGPNSFDCSGYVKYVYAHFGVRLPRVSRDQARVGTYVSRSNLQPGDLVFFGKGRIHHVGMYVGNGCYIHAPRTGDVVKISSLSSRSDYATARRVR